MRIRKRVVGEADRGHKVAFSDERRKAVVKKEPNDNGKPTCCAPGDLSACLIETTEERKKTPSEANLPKENPGADERKKSGKVPLVAVHESNLNH